MTRSPAFLDIRRVEAAREIATILSRSRNRVFLEADTLLLNLTQGYDKNLERRQPGASAGTAPADKGNKK